MLYGDALRTAGGNVSLRLGHPWIRSLPLSSVDQMRVVIDGQEIPIDRLRVHIDGVDHYVDDLPSDRWWFLQDRLVVSVHVTLAPGAHDVTVGFVLLIPYLSVGDRVLVVPVEKDARLVLNAPLETSAARDVR